MTRSRPTTRVVDTAVDRAWLPDPLLRVIIRWLLRRRHAAVTAGSIEDRAARQRALLAALAASPVATATDEANEQHYEVGTAFFERMLGPHLKYSSGYWPAGVDTLAGAEEAMLRLTCTRARLRDGQDVLELGCGWGSLTLWMAEHYPSSRITAISNSSTQREYIERQAVLRGLDNVRVVTADVDQLGVHDGPGDRLDAEVVGPDAFDRVVSVEMFEHVRNHGELTRRIATWLRPGGELFVHVFAHATDAYPFEVGENADWMARHFFTGGLMPSHDLLLLSVEGLVPAERWAVSGRHYARTLRAWLDRLDSDREAALAALATDGGDPPAEVAFARWRVFTIACEELFAADGGDRWHVAHLRFTRPLPDADRREP